MVNLSRPTYADTGVCFQCMQVLIWKWPATTPPVSKHWCKTTSFYPMHQNLQAFFAHLSLPELTSYTWPAKLPFHLWNPEIVHILLRSLLCNMLGHSLYSWSLAKWFLRKDWCNCKEVLVSHGAWASCFPRVKKFHMFDLQNNTHWIFAEV